MEDFRQEGEAHSRALTKDLKAIQAREDLPKIMPKLKKRFNDLIDLMITARTYQQKHPEEEIMESPFASEPASFLLLEELQRVYALEGGREAIENAQREALIRLDAFERNLAKKRGTFVKTGF
jgi:hypothetical protein